MLGARADRRIAARVDVTDRASVDAMVAACVAKFGRVDGLVNNAALYATLKGGRFDQIPEADWDAAMNVNVELLLRTTGDDRHRAMLREIRHASDRSAALTKQLLAFARRQLIEPKIVDPNQLVGRVEGLQVTSRRSSGAVQAKNLDVPAIGRELGVTHVLEGTVRSALDRLRVSVTLSGAADGFQIWSVVLAYPMAMIAVGFHLRHGMWSALTTLGANTSSLARQRLNVLAYAVAGVVTIGFLLPPYAILFGFVS